MTVLALAEPALDLSEFDIGGHVSRPNNLFVYAGRNLYRPGETFHVGAARDLDGRVMPPSLTATIKRPTAAWCRPRCGSPRRTCRLRRARHRSAAGRPDRHLAAGAARRPRVARSGCLVEVPGRGIPARAHEDDARYGTAGAEPRRRAVDRCAGRLPVRRAAAGNRLLATFQVKRNRGLPQQWPGFIFGDVADDSRRTFGELPELRWTTTARPSSK